MKRTGVAAAPLHHGQSRVVGPDYDAVVDIDCHA